MQKKKTLLILRHSKEQHTSWDFSPKRMHQRRAYILKSNQLHTKPTLKKDIFYRKSQMNNYLLFEYFPRKFAFSFSHCCDFSRFPRKSLTQIDYFLEQF
jgi:hypothetical protein